MAEKEKREKPPEEPPKDGFTLKCPACDSENYDGVFCSDCGHPH